MCSRRLILGFPIVFSALFAAAAASAAVLPGHIPKQIRTAAKLDRLVADEKVDLTLVVRLDPDVLAKALADMYGPGAPAHKHFLNPAEFAQKFDLARKRQALKDFAAGAGLTVAAEDNPGSLVVKVSGPSAHVEKAFGVQLSHYRDAKGQVFRANDTDPTIPDSLLPHLNAVLGLSNFRGAKKPRMIRGHPASRNSKVARSSTPAAARPSVCTAPFCGTGPSYGLAPADIKSIYGLSGSLSGAGQTVALVELDGYAPTDITLYQNQFGLAHTPVTCTSADGSCGLCGFNQDSQCNAATLADDGGMIEVALDIDMMLALSPGVSNLLVYTAQNYDSNLLTAYANIASNGSVSVISTSWGNDEEDAYIGLSSFMTSESEVFSQMALNGQTMISAAGDAGAYDASGATESDGITLESFDGALLVDDPASQPFVMGVGGTTLSGTVSSPSETVWNEGCSSSNDPGVNCKLNGAGGGGIANFLQGSTTYYPLPSYQSGVSGTYSQVYRNVPDVALNADPDASPYSICVAGSCNACTAPLTGGEDGLCDDTCDSSCNTLIGGTSAAAPLWAGLTALINQQRAANGYELLGFANPALYTLGTGGSYHSVFNDITSGNNGFYLAASGYDNASGWGSFKANAMITALAPVSVPAPVVTSARSASGAVGTAFSYTITASNNPTSYGAASLPAGLSVNTSNGVISGTPQSAGTASATISATNASGTGTAPLAFTITAAATPVPAITSVHSATGTVGAAFSYAITATNSPTSFAAAALPPGLSVNTSNGVVSGTPTSAGTFPASVSATNAGGTGSAALSITIGAAPTVPVLTATPTSNSSIRWSWPAVYGATAYTLDSLPGQALMYAGGSLSFTSSGLSVNTGYEAEVAAGSPPSSAFSQAVAFTLANPPTFPAVSAVYASSIAFSWNSNGNPAGTFYQVLVSTDPAFSVVTATLTVSAPAATASGLLPGTVYYSQVQALNGVQIPTAFVALPQTTIPLNTSVTVNASPSSAYVAPSGLVGEWQFDEDTGAVTADGSGGGDSGNFGCSAVGSACVSTPTWTSSLPGLGSAAAFSGEAGGVVLTNTGAPFQFTGSLTVEAWVNPQTAAQPAGAGIVAVGPQNSEDFALDISPSLSYRFLTSNSGAEVTAVATASIVPGQWTRVVGVYDAAHASATLYLNGVQAAVHLGMPARSNSGTVLAIGNRMNAGSRYALPFYGSIDSVRVIAGALTAAQVLSDYTGGFVSSVTAPAPNTGVVVALPPNAFGALASPAQIFISADPLNAPIRVSPAALTAGLAAAPSGLGLVPNSLIEVVPVVNGAPFTGPLGSSATLTIPYPDPGNTGVVSGTNPPLAAAGIQMYTLNTAVNSWTLLPTVVDKSARSASGVTPHFSVFALFAPETFGASAASARAYPVPWKPGTGGRFDAPGVTFADLPASGTISILTFAGLPVRSLPFSGASGGTVVWDGTSNEGRRAASGVYFARITGADGTSLVKFAIER